MRGTCTGLTGGSQALIRCSRHRRDAVSRVPHNGFTLIELICRCLYSRNITGSDITLVSATANKYSAQSGCRRIAGRYD